jgi:hypothetical protein
MLDRLMKARAAITASTGSARFASYLVIACSAAIFLLLLVILRRNDPALDFVLLLGAAIVALRLGGLLPALAAIALGTVCIVVALRPMNSFVLPDFRGMLLLALLAAVAATGLISFAHIRTRS